MDLTQSAGVVAVANKKGLPSFLANENLRLLVFCGKGGTGKTTSAAATALRLAELHKEKRILLISTDPAHSVGDSLGYPIGTTITPIRGTNNLWALEIEPTGVLEAFKIRHSREIKKTIDRAAILHQADVREFLSFSLPGMEQVMTFIEVAGMLKSTWYEPSKYDVIVMDTPPTGQLAEFLSVLEETDKWVDVFKTALSRSLWFRGQHKGDFVTEFVEDMRTSLGVVRSLINNIQETEFVPVTIPEAMSIYETEDLVAVLEKRQLPIGNIIVNRVRLNGSCPFCSPTGETGKEPVEEIEGRFGRFNLIRVPLFPHEVREDALASFGEILCGGTYRYRSAQPIESLPAELPTAITQMSDLLKSSLQFILFSGKGGVGKTSVAAATALYIAQHYAGKKALLYSLDPAHSVADSLGYPLGDSVISIPGVENLYATEVDTAKLRHDFMGEYRAIITGAFDTWERKRGAKLDIRFDRNILVSLAQTTPPGLDEILALERVLGSSEKGEYDLYILDMAPTGHALHLLEFPQSIRDWLSKAYRGLAKHNRDLPLDNLEALGNKIMKSTITVRKIKQALTNPGKSEFVAVTIPEAMGIAEAKRLLSAVTRLGIPCHHIVVNMIIPPTECNSCSSKREEQLKYIQELMDAKAPQHIVSEMPLFPHQIRGIDQLGKLADVLYR